MTTSLLEKKHISSAAGYEEEEDRKNLRAKAEIILWHAVSALRKESTETMHQEEKEQEPWFLFSASQTLHCEIVPLVALFDTLPEFASWKVVEWESEEGESEEEVSEPGEDYAVEGIWVDHDVAAEFHDELVRLRQRHGIHE